MDQLKLDIKGLEIGYASRNSRMSVFKGLNFSLTGGQLVGVVGNNGVGKSTLLRTITGLQSKLSGEVLINNRSIDQWGKAEFAKKMCIVLTEKVSGFNLTVTDLVAMGRVPYTDSFNHLQEKDMQLIGEAISVCGLNGHQHKLLAELSDGLFQKAMIAKGLAQETDLMLLDEPTAYLDFPSKHQLFELLKNTCLSKSKCIVISSHDIDLLLKYASHLLILSDDGNFEYMETRNHLNSSLFNRVTGNYYK